MCHCDLGEIRTEGGMRSAPPEKKERLEIEEVKTPRKFQGVVNVYISLLEILANKEIIPRFFLNYEFASAN